MLHKMTYRLALDLGSASLGWSVIRLDRNEQPCAIIRSGVRIFPDSRNPQDKSSLAVTRRVARAARRRRDRLLKRKNRLMNALIQHGFFPNDINERSKLVNLNPYQLRAEGLHRALTPSEFARAVFHLNQRRGFLSNRKTDKKENDSGILKGAIKDLRKKLEDEKCCTLGEWLAKRHAKGESVRARLHGKTQKDKAYDYYADRAMFEHEFNALWDAQKQHNPSLFTSYKYEELKNIMLHQRPLKPVVPGRCTLMPDEKRAPKALPSTQRFHIYQELNNLRFLTDMLQEQPLSLSQRDMLAELFEKKSTVTFDAMIKALKLSGSTKFNFQDGKRNHLKGNSTSVALAKPECFGAKWSEFSLALQDEIVLQLLNEECEGRLIEWLKKETGVDEIQAEKIAHVGLPEGYARLSHAALNRIVPVLMAELITYDKAVLKAGFDSHSALSHSQQTGEVMEELPYYGIPLCRHVAFEKENPRNDEERFGKIANPTVHVGLNQVRVVVNALIKEYGHPSQIIVEVARELKQSRELKEEAKKTQKMNQDRNRHYIEDACRVLGLEADHLDKSKRRELSQKMQLWIELNPENVVDRCCPYSGEPISIERLLSSDVEIEHILPYCRTLDDSMSNKTVAMSKANRIKGNQTPYEAFGRIPQAGYDYADIVQRAQLMQRGKRKRFAQDGYEQWLKEDKDFLSRALNDTAFLSRIAKEYLTCICPYNRVWVIPGQMTALLRYELGLNNLLSVNGQKNREDHRHHALDAMVIGITDRAMLQKFAHANEQAGEQGLYRLVKKLDLPWSNYRQHVERALHNIVISYKPEHGYQGAMHDDSAWGFLADGYVRRHVREEGLRIETLTVISFDKKAIARDGVNDQKQPKNYKSDGNYYMKIWRNEKGYWVSDVLSTFDAYKLIRQQRTSKLKVISLEADDICQLRIEKVKVIPLNDKKAITHYGVDDQGQPKNYEGYRGDSKYFMEIWRNENGRWVSDLISTFDAYQFQLLRQQKIEKLKVIPINDNNDKKEKAISRHGVDEQGRPKNYKGYKGDSNYCMEIWRNEKGRWASEVISTFDVYQIIRQHGEIEGWKRLRHPSLTQSGKPLVMRLMNKDYVRLEINGEVKTMVIAKITSDGNFFMAEHNEANVDARNRSKETSFSYVSKLAGSLQKAKGRRCTVSETGKLRDPGFKA